MLVSVCVHIAPSLSVNSYGRSHHDPNASQAHATHVPGYCWSSKPVGTKPNGRNRWQLVA